MLLLLARAKVGDSVPASDEYVSKQQTRPSVAAGGALRAFCVLLVLSAAAGVTMSLSKPLLIDRCKVDSNVSVQNDTVQLSDDGNVTTVGEEFNRSARKHDNKSQAASKPISPILPRRHIIVFGMESSGTTFFASVIGRQAGVSVKEGIQRRKGHPETEVIHVSQPWGSSCNKTKDTRGIIMPVLYPQECTHDKMASDAFDGTYPHSKMLNASEACIKLGACQHGNKIVYYPFRFFVDIVSHVQWYRDRGVDATAVIVSREKNIGHAARRWDHCRDEAKLAEEEKKGTKLLEDAIDKLPLMYNASSSLPSPPVVLVSFEQVLLFGHAYIRKIMGELGLPWRAENELFVKDVDAAYVKNVDVLMKEKKAKAAEKKAKEAGGG